MARFINKIAAVTITVLLMLSIVTVVLAEASNSWPSDFDIKEMPLYGHGVLDEEFGIYNAPKLFIDKTEGFYTQELLARKRFNAKTFYVIQRDFTADDGTSKPVMALCSKEEAPDGWTLLGEYLYSYSDSIFLIINDEMNGTKPPIHQTAAPADWALANTYEDCIGFVDKWAPMNLGGNPTKLSTYDAEHCEMMLEGSPEWVREIIFANDFNYVGKE